jgi:hypothetical protein
MFQMELFGIGDDQPFPKQVDPRTATICEFRFMMLDKNGLSLPDGSPSPDVAVWVVLTDINGNRYMGATSGTLFEMIWKDYQELRNSWREGRPAESPFKPPENKGIDPGLN